MSEAKKVTAIVARAVPYRDTDMILTLVTLEEGCITAVARGCLKSGAKLRYAAQPLNYGEYMLVGRGNSVSECSQFDSFTNLTENLESYYAAFLILDVLAKASPESNPPMFKCALEGLYALSGGISGQVVVTRFLLDALRANGANLNFDACNVCKCKLEGDCAVSESDGVVCRDCASYGDFGVDANTRAYLAAQEESTPQIRQKANILLADLVYSMLGIKISKHYFMEQI